MGQLTRGVRPGRRLFVLVLALVTMSLWVVPLSAGAVVRDSLGPGQRLGPNERLTSANGMYVLVQQSDGNLVLVAPGNRPIWSSGTHGHANSTFVFQSDGNGVVIAPGNRPIWSTLSWGNPGSVLRLQNDGNLVIYRPGNIAVWASYTSGGKATNPDIVTVGREIQRLGFAVTEHPSFGGVSPVHTTGSWHYRGKAIDVNFYPKSGEPTKLDELKRWIIHRVPSPTELLWRVSGHHDHLHLAIR